MKILFVLGSMTKGGAERVVANLSNTFCKSNNISIVVTPPDEPMYELDEKIKFITLDNKKNSKSFLIKNIKRTLKLKRILNDLQPDIILSFLPEPTYRLMLANFNRKYKTIISVRNDPNIEYNNIIKKILVYFLYNRADGFVFQTPDAKKWFNTSIQEKSTVIPNPINTDFIIEPYLGKREKTIVTVGRLVEQKNQLFLINTFSIIHQKHSDYILKIYGDGPMKNDLLSKISKLGLSEYVFLMGEVNDVKNEIYKAGMFVLTSDYEGMPNALMEAMAMGVPCISSNCPIGGPKFLIQNGINGYLYQIGNQTELIDRIDDIILKDTINISKNSCKISKKLNPTKINKQWMDYIIEVIDKKKL